MKGLSVAEHRLLHQQSATGRLLPRPHLPLAVAALCSTLFVAPAATADIDDNPERHLTTLLDSPRAQVIDGPAPLARTGFLKSMTSDSKGNLYFSDAASHSIRQISVDGIVRTLSHEVLWNVDFMAVDSNDQLYFLQMSNFFRPDPFWEVKRLHESGDTELVARGDGRAFGMEHDLQDGFILHLNHSRYDDKHHEFIRVSSDGQQEVIHDSRITGGVAPQRPLSQVYGMAVDNDGVLTVIDGLTIRRIYDNGEVQDSAFFSPGIGMLARDIAFTPSNEVVLCTQGEISIWDLSTYQLVDMIGLSPSSVPVDDRATTFASIRRCHADSQNNINVMHMDGTAHHSISRVHAAPDPVVFPALHDYADFEQMLHEYAAATSTVRDNGIVEVNVDGHAYQLIAAHGVSEGTAGRAAGIHEIDDRNGDGIDEFLLIFPDRTEQLMYLLPPN